MSLYVSMHEFTLANYFVPSVLLLHGKIFRFVVIVAVLHPIPVIPHPHWDEMLSGLVAALLAYFFWLSEKFVS